MLEIFSKKTRDFSFRLENGVLWRYGFVSMRRNAGQKTVSVRSVAGVLAGLKDGALTGQFLGALLTPRELSRLDLRWRLVCLLAAGVPQREIAKKLGVSLCKITRGSRELRTRPDFRGIVTEYVNNVKGKEKT